LEILQNFVAFSEYMNFKIRPSNKVLSLSKLDTVQCAS
jgi:hypothetical protein